MKVLDSFKDKAQDWAGFLVMAKGRRGNVFIVNPQKYGPGLSVVNIMTSYGWTFFFLLLKWCY